jgi:DNA topoisomerase-1
MQDKVSIKVPKKKLLLLQTDSKKYAEAVSLVYGTDTAPGITRKRTGKTFIYFFKDKKVTDKNILHRIKSLVIPPAWENVWINPLPEGHLQVTGLDVRKRKQYKYHPQWDQLRNETKFHRMIEFGKVLPALRAQVEKDLRNPEMTQEKVLATIVKLMEHTAIRIGNNSYEKEYGSYGLTTLKNRHVKINGSSIRFSFVGKKGVAQSITLRSKRMARIVRQCMEIPGQELFQYVDEKGEPHMIDSGKVNAYIKTITGSDMTAKDFRTWIGSVVALRTFMNAAKAENATSSKKTILEVLDEVSKQLGNTRSVTRKYYVHPALISLYENNALDKYFKKPISGIEGLSDEEKILMKILEKN